MKKNEREERRSRKVLIPLATLTVAAAVAVGSGATWTSTSNNSVSVTAGKLVAVNDHDAGTLKVEHLKPGASVSEVVTISEGTDNDVDADLKLIPSGISSGMTAGDLKIEIRRDNGAGTGPINFENLKNVNLGLLADGYGSTQVTITVSMAASAGNEDQGKTASVNLQFVATATTDPSTNSTATWTP